MNHRGTDNAGARGEALYTPSRRDFLRVVGFGSAACLLPSFLTACNEPTVGVADTAMINLNNDVGVMNYAYMMAHFQYEFYRYITYAPYIGARTLEVVNQVTGVFARFQVHAAAQRTLFRNTMPEGRIPDAVDFDFPDVNFSSRTSVFAFLQTMEDRGVQVYCTLLTRCQSADTLTVLSKIASVKARHSAVVRDLMDIDAGRSDTADRVSFASDALIPVGTGLENLGSLTDYMNLIQTYTQTRITMVGA